MTVVDDIKARLDILEVVGQRVPLQRSGRSYKGNCPFHQERTPSFHVFPERQSWRCFGACATGGDAFSFVMRAENLEFGEALRELSRRTGVPLQESREPRVDPTAYEINEAARAYFQRFLASTQGADARAYMERRGLDRDAADAFQIGLAPSDGQSLGSHLTGAGFSAVQLLAAGVARASDDGRQRDLFRGRLMFPIRDAEGRLAGFGGRSLDDSEPKYLNSPQGEVFDKSRILYAMDRARDDIRKNGAVIVEGYMDAIAAHQAGFRNVVASMGTALTEPQVEAIRRITGRVTMALDQDAAGQQATLRSLESSWRILQSRVAGQYRGATLLNRPDIPEIRIAAMPAGQDPDEVIRRSPAEWNKLVDNARPLLEFVISAMTAAIDPAKPEGKDGVIRAVFPLVAAEQDGPRQDYYFQMLAQKLNVTPDFLLANYGRPAARRPRPEPNRPPTERPNANRAAENSPFASLERDPVEEFCLLLLMRYPDLAEYSEPLAPDHFWRHENREIFSNYLNSGHAAGSVAGDTAGNTAGNTGDSTLDGAPPGVREQVEALRQKPLPPMDFAKRRWAMADVVAQLEKRSLRRLKAEERIRFSESPPDLDAEDLQDTVAVNRRMKHTEVRSRSRGLY